MKATLVSTVAHLAVLFAFMLTPFACGHVLPQPVSPDASDASSFVEASVEVLEAGTPDADMADAAPYSAPDAAKLSACAQAELTLKTLGCPEGAPADGGLSFAALCLQTQKAGHFDVKAECIAKAKSVAGVQTCNVRCKK